jgi:hypothetical protein
MNTATSKTGKQGETGSKRSISRTGSFGRALGEIEPGQLSQSDLAYLRFFLLALHSSMKGALSSRLPIRAVLRRCTTGCRVSCLT